MKIFTSRSNTNFLILALICLGSLSFFSGTNYHFLPAPKIFEVVFLILCCWSMATQFKINKFNFFMLLFIVAVIIIIFLRSYFIFGTGFIDTFIATKSLFYLIIFLFISTKKISISSDHIFHLFCITLYLFFAKYVVQYFIYNVNRPGIFGENNFEMMFLLILFTFVSIYNKLKITPCKSFLLFLVVLLSGSRSAQLSYVFIILLLQFSDVKSINLSILFKAVFAFGVVCILIVLSLTLRPINSLEGIDRFSFLLVFLDELKDMPLGNMLFGKLAIAPLQPASCSQLSYYTSLFSRSGDGTCYSVILHSFIMRAIIDFGLIGSLVIAYLYFMVLRTAGHHSFFSLAIISIGFINSLSVSGMNNIFYALGVLVTLTYCSSSSTSIRVRSHNQNITVAARAFADRKTFWQRS
jgi:hypothetical protein